MRRGDARTAPFTIPVRQGPIAVWADRATAAGVVLAAAAGTVVLARLAPDPRGHGTHEQLGLAPCGWPAAYGIPCPTCGCTTAACLLVHGDVPGAFATQPFGALAALAGVLLGLHAAWCLLRGRSFADLAVRLPVGRVVAAGFVLMLLAWWYTYLVFAA